MAIAIDEGQHLDMLIKFINFKNTKGVGLYSGDEDDSGEVWWWSKIVILHKV